MMDYEKKYNEILAWAKKYKARLNGVPIEDIFPELCESEDERIRKEIIGVIQKHYQNTPESYRWISWLEKQKEQEHICDSAQYEEGFKTGLEIGLRKQKEQKPELVQQPPITYTYNSNASREERLKAALLALLNSDLLKVEGGYFTKQDLIEWVERIDMPAEWSEEDEMIRNAILGFLNPDKGGTKYSSNAELVWWSNWLKSLRPSWKPSEEHLSALLAIFNDPNNIGSQTCQLALTDLYEQLKKL